VNKQLVLIASAGGLVLIGRSLAPPAPPRYSLDVQRIYAHRQAMLPYYVGATLLAFAAAVPWMAKGRW
jgi:hypothetical protein